MCEPCVPTVEELQFMDSAAALRSAASSTVPAASMGSAPPRDHPRCDDASLQHASVVSASTAAGVVSEPCVPTAEELRIIAVAATASVRAAATSAAPALVASDSALLLARAPSSTALAVPQSISSSPSTAASDDDEWRRMPCVPTDEERARTNAEELRSHRKKAEGGDGTVDDSKAEPGVPLPTAPPQVESTRAAVATIQLAEPAQPSGPAAASSPSAAEAALLEQQAMLQQQQAALRAQMAAVEAKLEAVRAMKAD